MHNARQQQQREKKAANKALAAAAEQQEGHPAAEPDEGAAEPQGQPTAALSAMQVGGSVLDDAARHYWGCGARPFKTSYRQAPNRYTSVAGDKEPPRLTISGAM